MSGGHGDDKSKSRLEPEQPASKLVLQGDCMRNYTNHIHGDPSCYRFHCKRYRFTAQDYWFKLKTLSFIFPYRFTGPARLPRLIVIVNTRAIQPIIARGSPAH